MALPSVPQGYDSWNEFIEDNAPAVAQAQGLTLQEAKASLKLLYVSEPIRSAVGEPYYREYNVFTNWASRALLPDQGRPWKLDLNISVANILQGTSSYWLDPSDFSTMWQDSQGVTPVTAPGQTCGLILDKSIGTQTQVFNDANVTFSGTAGYAGRISSGVYELARDASGNGNVFFGGLTAGKTYLVSVQISAYAGSIPGVTGISVAFVNGASITVRPQVSAAGTYTFFFTADATFFRCYSNFVGSGGTISNVSILEVPGNHFLQGSLSNRPILGREPFGGRRNLFTFTEEFDNLAWTKAGTIVTPNVVAAPDGTMTADSISYTGGGANQLNNGFSTAITAPITISFWARRGPVSTGLAGLRVGLRNNGIVVAAAFSYTPTEEWQRFSFQYTPSGTGVDRIYFYNSPAASNGVPFYLWGAQIEVGSAVTAYQKVTTSFDVTEIGVPDCYYLAFDGSDDWLQSAATINPGAVDKAQVFAGVRKLSDAGFAPVILEVSASAGVNNGTVALFSNSGAGAPADYSGFSRGTTSVAIDTANTFAAPITNVLTLLSDISGDSATLRVNGAEAASSTADQGTGNYLTYLHYIGRRGGTTLPYNGRIYGLVVRYGPNLSTAQIESLEDWTASKTGIVI